MSQVAFLFRYVRYNGVGSRRATLERADETPATVADGELRKPRLARRLGTLDPETSKIIWQDEVVDAIGPGPLEAPEPSSTYRAVRAPGG